MNLDRTLLKRDAMARMQRYKPNPILIGLIVFLLVWVLQYLALSVLGLNFEMELDRKAFQSPDAMMQFYSQFQKELAAHFHPSVFALVLAVALTVMHLMVNVGHMIYSLRVVREQKADFGNLLDGFAFFGKAVALGVLELILIYIGTMLLIVPGVILYYRYRQAFYLLIDYPDRSPVDCMRASASLMRGHKMELFVLDLSFLGWAIVQYILPPMGIVTEPYFKLTYANYYRALRGETIPAPAPTDREEEENTGFPRDDENNR